MNNLTIPIALVIVLTMSGCAVNFSDETQSPQNPSVPDRYFIDFEAKGQSFVIDSSIEASASINGNAIDLSTRRLSGSKHYSFFAEISDPSLACAGSFELSGTVNWQYLALLFPVRDSKTITSIVEIDTKEELRLFPNPGEFIQNNFPGVGYISIQNRFSNSVTINDVAVVSVDPNVWSLVSPPSFPVTLGCGEQIQIQVRCAVPDSAGQLNVYPAGMAFQNAQLMCRQNPP